MKIGDLVQLNTLRYDGLGVLGIVIEVDINMWREETIPSGVRVLWGTNEEECVWEDEIYIVE